jgi:hypothetical protein
LNGVENEDRHDLCGPADGGAQVNAEPERPAAKTGRKILPQQERAIAAVTQCKRELLQAQELARNAEV